MAKLPLYYLCFVTSCLACALQPFSYDNYDNLYLCIHQLLVEPELKVIIKNDKLAIYEIKYRIKQSASSAKYKKLHEKKLEKSEFKKFIPAISKLYLVERQRISPQLGGIEWQIFVMYENKENHIQVINENVPEVAALFHEINRLLPQGIPKLLTY